jgi:Cdc6-like AAA superfamily ATPase
MSIEALRAALSPAFDPELPPSELAACHTPYARLNADDVEARLRTLLESYNRVAITGPVGCGKTSLARFVADGSPALAPIYLNVAAEDRDKLKTPRGFQELLLTHLADAADESLGGGERERLLRRGQPATDLAGVERHTGGELGADWIAKVAGDLTKTLPPRESYRNIRQMAEPSNDALDAIRAYDLVPVVVADDTDRLLRLPGEDGEQLFQAFFGEVLRSLVDQLHDFALIVAVHDDYRERDDYAELVSGRIEHHLDVPILSEPRQLAEIFETRAAFLLRDPEDPAAGAFGRADVLADEAVEELHALHVGAHARSLRRTLATAKGAIGFAVDELTDTVFARHVRAAASDT